MDSQINNSVTTIQRHIRGFLARKKLEEANTIYRAIFREIGDESFVDKIPVPVFSNSVTSFPSKPKIVIGNPVHNADGTTPAKKSLSFPGKLSTHRVIRSKLHTNITGDSSSPDTSPGHCTTTETTGKYTVTPQPVVQSPDNRRKLTSSNNTVLYSGSQAAGSSRSPSSEDLREQVKSNLFMTAEDSLQQSMSHLHASRVQQAHSAHRTTSQVDQPAKTRSGPIERRHQPPRVDEPPPILYINPVTPPTDSHISVETFAIPALSPAGTPQQYQTNNNTVSRSTQSPKRRESKVGRRNSEERSTAATRSPVTVQVTVDADNLTPVTIQVNSPQKSSNLNSNSNHTTPTHQTPPVSSSIPPKPTQPRPISAESAPSLERIIHTTNENQETVHNLKHNKPQTTAVSNDRSTEPHRSEIRCSVPSDQHRAPYNYEDKEETIISTESSLTHVSDLEGSKLKDRSLFENQPSASTPIQVKSTHKHTQLGDIEVSSNTDSMEDTSIWTTSHTKSYPTTDTNTLRKARSVMTGEDKSNTSVKTDKKASDLKTLRDNAALELVWIEQAIASRKQYLQLKEKMKDKSK